MSRQHDYYTSMVVSASRSPPWADVASTSMRSRRYTHNPYAAPLSKLSSTAKRPDQPDPSADGKQNNNNTNNSNSNINISAGLEEQLAAAAGSLAALAKNASGRQMILAALRHLKADAARTVADEIAEELNVIALDANGCHVVRALFETLPTDHAVALVQRLHPETVVELAVGSQHTRRVLQVIFERHKSEALGPIVAVIAQHSPFLAMSQQGCIAVIRVIENALPPQRNTVIAALLPVLPTLTMNCYGNYVVQCILQHMDHCTLVSVVCNAFAGHWVMLSRNKFASNVIEKVVWQLDGNARRALVAELVLETQNLRCLMQDGFGNFVLQAIIESSSDPNEFREICNRVRPLLQTCPYGHKIESKMYGNVVRSSRVTPVQRGVDVPIPVELAEMKR